VSSVVPSFTWTGPGGVTQYEIYVSDLTTGQVQDKTVAGTTWTPGTALVSGHSYRWWVRALGSGGSAGAWSSSADFAVGLPSLIGPSSTVSSVLPAFTWNGLTGVNQYELYLSDLATGNVQDVSTNGPTWTSSTPLISGHSYRWWVRALGSSGAGVWSKSLDFAVALPTLIGPANTIGTQLPAFTWNGIAAAQSEIYLSDLVTGSVVDRKLTGTTWTPAAPLISGHSYRWWVRAVGSDGSLGVWSASLDFHIS
jgi:hypothetical protein